MLALLALLLAANPPGPVGAALDLEQQGKAAEAVALLAGVSAKPGDALAGRALYEQARIVDEHFRDPLRAATLYGAYVAAYPAGPYAHLSADRRDYLIKNATPAPEAFAEFEDILRELPRLPEDQAIARMAAVVEKYPRFPLRARACFWLANADRQRGDWDGAARWLAVIVRDEPDSPDAHRAEITLGQNLVAQHRFAEAIALFARYLDSADPLARELARSQIFFARERRRWYWLFCGGVALLLGWLLGLAAALWRRRVPLRPFPFEAKLFAPVAAVIVALTVFENRKVGAAVAAICAAGLLFTVLNGAYLRAATGRGVARWAHVLVAAAASASLAFCAIQAFGLTELVVDTIEQGADR